MSTTARHKQRRTLCGAAREAVAYFTTTPGPESAFRGRHARTSHQVYIETFETLMAEAGSLRVVATGSATVQASGSAFVQDGAR